MVGISFSLQRSSCCECTTQPLFFNRHMFNKQVAPHEIIELDADDDHDGVTIIDAKTSDYKNKQAVGHPVNCWKNAKVDPLCTCLLLMPLVCAIYH